MKISEARRAHLLIIASKIDLLMADRLVSQAELARRMKTDRSTVCRVLQGKDFTVSTLCAFIEALEAEIDIKPKRVAPDAVL